METQNNSEDFNRELIATVGRESKVSTLREIIGAYFEEDEIEGVIEEASSVDLLESSSTLKRTYDEKHMQRMAELIRQDFEEDEIEGVIEEASSVDLLESPYTLKRTYDEKHMQRIAELIRQDIQNDE